MSDEDESEEFSDDDEDLDFDQWSAKWSKDRTVYHMMEFAANLQQATATFFAQVANSTAADHNFKVDQNLLHEQVAKEIETLPTFTEPEA